MQHWKLSAPCAVSTQ